MEVGKEYVKPLDNKQFNKIIKELEHFVANNKMLERSDNMEQNDIATPIIKDWGGIYENSHR